MNSLIEKRKREISDDASTDEVKKVKCELENCINNSAETSPEIDFTENESKFTYSIEDKFNEKHFCFACKDSDDNLIKCSVNSCDKMYHSKCLEKLPTTKSEVHGCSLHICLTCYNINAKNVQVSKGEMYKCLKCPTAFHKKEECYIPGSVALTEDIICCPNHFSPEKQRQYSAVVHLTFCIHCGGNESLIFCKYCPAAVHKICIKNNNTMNETEYVCDRCDTRQIVLYNDIVWVKICDFRWWPARITNPQELPEANKRINHFDGEFPIQFFKTEEYYWVSVGRIYPFVYKHIGIEDEVKHNFKIFITDVYFDEAVKLAISAIQNKKVVQKSAEPVNTKKPPHYKHIKSNRPIGNVQIYSNLDDSDDNTCGCELTDTNPCGYDTICLNRNTLQECHDGICEMGDLCQNRKFIKVENAPSKPFYTETRGWGLKAMADIKKGHFVIEYVGDLIDEEECNLRIKQKQAIGDTNFYFCTLDSTRIIDAGPKGNFSRFINHSCDPNCETQKWIVNGDARVGIFARKDIKEGSEITFDYQMDFSHYKKLQCNCGSDRCSGLIGKKPQNGSGLLQNETEDTVFNELEINNSHETKDVVKNSNKKKSVNGIKNNDIIKNSNKKKSIDAVKNIDNAKSSNKKKSINAVKDIDNAKSSNKKKSINAIKDIDNAKSSNKNKSVNGMQDSDNAKTNGISKIDGVKVMCFKCNTGGKLVKCSRKDCGKYFHSRCLKSPKDALLDGWECPCHFCIKCKSKSIYQCQECPNAYCKNHIVIKPKAKLFLCPKHR